MDGRNIEAIYSFTPSQRGMLFETLADARPGVHVEQSVVRLRGEVDADTLRRAWEYLLGLHPALRAAFLWKQLEEPLQVVFREVPLGVESQDWSGLTAAEQHARLDEYLAADRLKGFDISRAPLLRLALFRTGADSHRMVWTNHHILFDGWCVPLLVRDLLKAYESIRQGRAPELRAPRPFKDYIVWLKRHDLSGAESFWRERLRGIARPTPPGAISSNGDAPAGAGYGERRMFLSRETTDALRLLARRKRVPLSVLFRGVWALLLSRYSGEERVVFGTTVSGRPAELAGAESMIGLFINTVPAVVEVSRGLDFWAWLGRLRESQLEAQPYEFCSTGQIHGWSGMPASLPLFESLLVYENYPLNPSELRFESFTIDMRDSHSVGAQTKYPLSLVVEPGAEVSFQAVYDRARLDARGVECVLQDILFVAESLARGAESRVGDLLEQLSHRPVPKVSRPARANASGGEPPRTATEAAVLSAWARTLGAERVGVGDNFFELGGHSLLATQLASRLRADFAVEVPLRAVFENPTVAGLSLWLDSALDEAKAEGRPDETPEINPAETEAAPPLSFQQERLWFLDQLGGGGSAYNAQAALRLAGELDADVLRASLREIVRRHEILRTAFVAKDGKVSQVVLPPPAPAFRAEDLRRASGGEVRAEVERLAADEMLRPFDLTEPPLLRALLVRTAEAEHVLVLTIHHIVTDGWSNAVFFRELTALYRAFKAGRPSPLPEPKIQYADFSAWQRRQLSGERLGRLLDYWKEKLSGAPPLLDLKTDAPRRPFQTQRGEVRALELDESLTGALRDLSRREGATMFMSLLAAFKLLLARHSGQDDVVLGTPIANRTAACTEDLIGFFANTLALRTDLSGGPTFAQLLARVRETALEAYAHQDVPFERLVEELHPERDLSHNPVFQVFFNMLNTRRESPALAGLEVSEYALPELVTKFDMTLYASEEGARLRFELVYNTELFRRETVDRLLEQLGLLLRQIAEDPARGIDSYTLLLERDRALLPDPAAELPPSPCGLVHAGFAEQAARVPHKTAVVDKDGAWSYAEIDALSNRLAHFLLEHGLSRGEVVAVYADASASLVWCLLGVLKAGASFLVLDAEHPPRRLLDSMRRAGAVAFIRLRGAGELPAELSEFAAGASLRCRLDVPAGRDLFDDGFELNRYPAGDPRVPVGEGDRAYVTFTSGTTGEPLCVVGTHAPVSHFLRWHVEAFGLREGDRFSLLSGLSHDPLLRDIFTPLRLGATLHVPAREDREVAGRLARWVEREGLTVMHLTPATAELLCRDAHGRDPALGSLRRVFFGGDRLTYGDVRRLKKLAPACSFVNFYGATETPQAVGYFELPPDAPDERADAETVPVGRGVEGAQLLVLNAGGRVCGVGERGEICVRTRHLSEGYLGEPERTRERFQTNPHTGAEGDRIYRTGDLGRYLPDGSVDFLGRRDRQLKIRGFRVEPREVESALASHPSLRDAAVVAADVDGETRLTAFVVAANESAPAGDECRAFLAERLPSYSIPARFHALEAVPLTPNGKIDYAELSRLARAAGAGRAFEPPADETEAALARIWREELNVGRVGATDNFFELGGHSLKATAVVGRVEREFGVRVPLRDFFLRATVRDMARACRDGAAATAVPAHRPIEPAPAAEHYPVSRAQRRMWALSQMEETSVAYNMPRALLLDGALDAAALGRALSRIVERHESLRTTFAFVGGELRQRIAPAGRLEVARVDLIGEADPLARAGELADEDASRPFDLGRGPLLRASLLRLAPERHVLLFNMHHIVSDYLSLTVLVGEFVRLYHSGDDAPPPLRIQYRDYAAWQAAMLEGEEARAHRTYWLDKLSGAPPALELPTDFARPAVKTYNGRRHSFTLGRRLTAALNDFSRAQRVTLYTTLLAVSKALLYRYTAQEDIVVGCPVAGRRHPDLAGQIGFYVNTLALRDRVEDGLAFGELLRRVERTVAEAHEHQDYPFDLLVEELNIAREVSRSPLFDVAVVLQNAETAELHMAGVRITPFTRESRVSKVDLNFTFEERDGELQGFVEYNTDLFTGERAEGMAEHFRALAAAALADPRVAVGRLDLLPAAERRRLLTEFSSPRVAREAETTQSEASARACVPHLFEEHARRAPEAVAVVARGETLTYAALNARANRLARYLCRLGVAPGAHVGLCAERGARLVTGMLAILKAGGAYVPLDPAYPLERLAYMIEDSGLSVLLTEESVQDNLPATWASVVSIDGVEAELERESPEDFDGGVGAGDAAYVIYTSGSTGRPKGVVVEHGGLGVMAGAQLRTFGATPGSRVLQFSSISFDASVFEMSMAFGAGAALCLPPPGPLLPGPELLEYLRSNSVTHVTLPPSVLVAARAEDLPALRVVVSAGEACPAQAVENWAGEGRRFFNAYGPTEATIWATVVECFAGGPRPSIGRPIPGTTVFILDRHMTPAPVGVAGELHVGGAGVARGYLARPELTSEKFIPDPFDTRPGARLYKTGDAARFLADGSVEFMGRTDRQLKIRGFRIEPGEVESALAAHPSVRASAVTAWRAAGGDARLVAYVASDEPGALLASQLRETLKGRLPDYMVPSHFVLLDALPLTPSGKVDYRALPAPNANGAGHAGGAAGEAPRDGFEREVANVWREVLGVERVALDDNFFDLGGHSLLLIQAHARLRETLGREIPVVEMFRHPTVRALGAYLNGATNGGADGASAAKPDALRQAQEAAERQRRARRRGPRT